MNSLPKTELTSSSKGLVNGSTDSKTAPTLPTNTGTNFGDKTLLDESQATIPTTAYSEPTSPKGLPGKNKRMSRMKKLGPKGLFSLFSCFTLNNDGVDEKTLDQPEKSSSPSPPTSSPRTSSSDVKPSLGDLIYSAVPGQSQPSTPVTPLPLRKDEKRLSLISKKHLLEPLSVEHHGRKCLVLDLDETLVHSSFKPIDNPDFVVPVEIDNQVHSVYVLKRPGVDEFLKRVGEVFEVVVFTASLAKYADPVMDILDIHRVVKHRLFRESCYNHNGNYVKDLSQLGRDLKHTIIIDNSPTSYLFHPNNAVPITTWFSDLHDNELVDLVPFLCDLATVDDVTKVLDASFSDHD